MGIEMFNSRDIRDAAPAGKTHLATKLARIYFLAGAAVLIILSFFVSAGRVGELVAYYLILGVGVAALAYGHTRPKTSWLVTTGLVVAWLYTVLILVVLVTM